MSRRDPRVASRMSVTQTRNALAAAAVAASRTSIPESSGGGGGTGDVTGPSGSMDDTIALFDGVTGKQIKDSTKTLSDLPGFLGLATVTYVDDQDTANSAADQAYADAGDATTLSSAEAYTDGEIAGLSSVYQPLDSDLTTIASLTATTDNFIQAKAGAWASRTPTQVATDLTAFNGPTVSSSATTASNTGSTNLTVSFPSGIQTGDTAICYVESALETVNTPSGWTLVSTSSSGGSAGGVDSTRLYVFSLVYNSGTHGASFTVTSGSIDHKFASCIWVRGASTISSQTNGATSSAQTMVTLFSAAPAVDDYIELIAASLPLSSTAIYPAFLQGFGDGLALRNNNTTSSGNGGLIMLRAIKRKLRGTLDAAILFGASSHAAYSVIRAV